MVCPRCGKGTVFMGFCSHCGNIYITEKEESYCGECEGVKQIGIDACQGCCRRK